ncbi:hypothetical protein ACC702_03390 [Rhizobium ruizarguesonis]|nr:hypothetical protein U8P68_27810 [Rhizobium ruizarguesonis]
MKTTGTSIFRLFQVKRRSCHTFDLDVENQAIGTGQLRGVQKFLGRREAYHVEAERLMETGQGFANRNVSSITAISLRAATTAISQYLSNNAGCLHGRRFTLFRI